MVTTAGLLTLAAVLTGPLGDAERPSDAARPPAANSRPDRLAQLGPIDSNTPGVKVSHCVVTSIGEMQVPARHPGILAELAPQEGDVITKGMHIAQIDDTDTKMKMNVARFEYESARQQADNNIRVLAAEASEKVAEANYEKMVDINEKAPGAVTQTELRRLRLEHTHADLQIGLAKLEFEVAGITSNARRQQHMLAQSEWENCQITAPWDGVMVERYRREGEWLQQGEPILRMVQMDRLRVEGFLKLADFSPLEVDGADVIMEFHLTRGRIERRTGTIDFVSPQVDGGEFRVWAYVDNTLEQNHRGKQQWLLLPGMMAEMTIILDKPDAKVAIR
jgi:multidrug resistance efflux pump